MTFHVIALNGPPSSGKDTACRMLRNWFSEHAVRNIEFKMSQEMKRLVHDFVGTPDVDSEAVKPLPTPLSRQTTYRQAYINFSENFAKPSFGDNVFGELAVRRFLEFDKQVGHKWVAVISDAGFAPEQEAVIASAGTSNYCLLRLHRPSYGFQGDSRSYLYFPRTIQWDVENNGTLDKLRVEMRAIAQQLAKKWKIKYEEPQGIEG